LYVYLTCVLILSIDI